jgi:hypothetical protein
MTRQEMIDGIWGNVDPSVEGYSRLIDRLLETLTDEQLRDFHGRFVGDPDETARADRTKGLRLMALTSRPFASARCMTGSTATDTCDLYAALTREAGAVVRSQKLPCEGREAAAGDRTKEDATIGPEECPDEMAG